ncbi:MAG: hypothetical protein ACI352_00080 [Elusimicrobiaceae bacterium]|nr:hypothetical protein [Elusimicrobiota bacterium]
MRKFLFCLTLLFLPLFLSAQGKLAAEGAKAVKGGKSALSLTKKVKLPRGASKPVKYVKVASSTKKLSELGFTGPAFAASLERNARVSEFLDRAINAKRIESELAALNYNRTLVPMLANPAEAWGSYGRIKGIARIAKSDPNIIRLQPAWHSIWKSQGFNGAHHIMNQYAIKQIWHTSPYAGHIDFGLVTRDAPAMFHPFHGKPAFGYVFHNPEVQVSLYMRGGVKAVMENQLMQINAINIEYGLPQLSETFLQNTMRRAKSWAKDYKLRWQ